MEAVLATLPSADQAGDEREAEGPQDVIKLAVIGRPNVGKSTLVNRLLGEERMLACDLPGTTPVSYTHLDVYKRQGWTGRFWRPV